MHIPIACSLLLQISVLCRNPAQATAAASVDWVDEVTLDFLGTHGLKASLAELRRAGKRVCVALPRITKPGEQGLWKFFVGLAPDALLLRSAGLLHALQKHMHEQEQQQEQLEREQLEREREQERSGASDAGASMGVSSTPLNGGSRRRGEGPAAAAPVATDAAADVAATNRPKDAEEKPAAVQRPEGPLIPGRRQSSHSVRSHRLASEAGQVPSQAETPSPQGGSSKSSAGGGALEDLPSAPSTQEAREQVRAQSSAARRKTKKLLEASKKPRKANAKSKKKLPELYGDFSLNAANSLSAAALLGAGLTRLTLTHDLNAEQMADLALNLPEALARRLEVVLHQHLPIFHTEHCVFCRFLSDGNSKEDCGHPCEHHSVHLRDAGGQDHLVLADMGCRNTVFNAEAQSGLPHAAALQRAGFRYVIASSARANV